MFDNSFDAKEQSYVRQSSRLLIVEERSPRAVSVNDDVIRATAGTSACGLFKRPLAIMTR